MFLKSISRPAAPSELPAVAALDAGQAPVLREMAAYRRYLERGARLQVVECDGEVVAFALWSPLAVDERELLNLVVDSGQRGQGVGRALLEESLAMLAAEGVRRVLLEVRAGNTAARALYDRCGFNEDGRRRGYYRARDGRPAEDAVLMSRLMDDLETRHACP